MASASVEGLDGDDTFNVSGNFSIPLLVSGGNPSASDVLNFSTVGAGAVTVDLAAQTVQQAGSGLVSFVGVEVLNANAAATAITVTASAGPDNISVTPTGANTATLVRAGQNLTVNTTNTSTLTVDAVAGTDTVTVNGTSAGETIAVVKGATTTVQVGGLKTVSLPAASDENVTVLAGDGDDTINVSGSTSNNQIININGGDPTASDTLTVTMSTAGATSVLPGATPDAGVITSPNGSTTFSGIEAITVTGTATGTNILNTPGTNANDTIALQHTGGADRISVNNRAVVTFANYATVNLDGLSGDDKINVSPVGLSATVTTIN